MKPPEGCLASSPILMSGQVFHLLCRGVVVPQDAAARQGAFERSAWWCRSASRNRAAASCGWRSGSSSHPYFLGQVAMTGQRPFARAGAWSSASSQHMSAGFQFRRARCLHAQGNVAACPDGVAARVRMQPKGGHSQAPPRGGRGLRCTQWSHEAFMTRPHSLTLTA